jgi:prevent-host-death family protein
MAQVNIYAAKTHLSKLLDRAVAGEEIVIARAGKPLVRLVPVAGPPARAVGGFENVIELEPDWDSAEVNDEITRELSGSSNPAGEP